MTMNFGIAFAPLVPSYVLWAAIMAAVLVAGLLVLAQIGRASCRERV